MMRRRRPGESRPSNEGNKKGEAEVPPPKKDWWQTELHDKQDNSTVDCVDEILSAHLLGGDVR